MYTEIMCGVIIITLLLVMYNGSKPVEHFDTYNNHYNRDNPDHVYKKYWWHVKNKNGNQVYDKMYNQILNDNNPNLNFSWNNKFSVLDSVSNLSNYTVLGMTQPEPASIVYNGQHHVFAQLNT